MIKIRRSYEHPHITWVLNEFPEHTKRWHVRVALTVYEIEQATNPWRYLRARLKEARSELKFYISQSNNKDNK